MASLKLKELLRKNNARREMKIVKNVRGRDFFINSVKPFLKFLLSISIINEKECLIECKKQK